MNQENTTGPKLSVITGGLHSRMSYGNLRIVAAPEQSPPFKIHAMAYEEDTYLIMSAQPDHAPRSDHPLRLMAQLSKLEPEKPGSVVVTGKNPFKFLAVVHNVDKEPTWRKEWIESALSSIFAEAEKRELNALGLPLLGAKHGKLKHHLFITLLARALGNTRLDHLRRLWIIAPVPENAQLIDLLKSQLKTTA